MTSDDQGPKVHNEISGSVRGDSFQAQNLIVINGLPAVSKPPPPRGLPAAPLLFVNRSREQRDVTTRVASSDSNAPVVIISGRRGVGSSSLAVQWGHCYGDPLYPDGTLYADLRQERSYGGTAVAAVLAQFLHSCGCDVPKDLASRQERYRSYLRGKRMLVVLDHVENQAEVRALRPSSAGSALIATCHFRGEYVTGQQDVSLDPLDFDAARELVSLLIGADRVSKAESEIAELIELCESVPELLCLAIGRMRRNRNVTPAEVTAWLRSELAGGGAERDRPSILDLVAADAYESLSSEAAWVYRILGCHPGPDVANAAIHALSEAAGADGLDVITQLCDRHLLNPHSDGRYRLPSLVQAHARLQARAVDGDDAEDRALSIWSDWYVGGAQAADRAFIKDRNRVFPLDAPVPMSFVDDEQAVAWLDTERHNLLALQRRLLQCGRFGTVMKLGEAMWVLYIGALYLEDWLESSRLCVEAAVAGRHLAAEVRFRAFLGRALVENAPNAPDPSRMYAEAERELDRARNLPTADGIGVDLRASAIEFKGRLLSYQGRYTEAIAHYTLASELFAQRAEYADALDDERRASRRGVALQHHFIGLSRLASGDYLGAVNDLRQAEMQLVDTGHYRDVAKIRTGIGEALRHMGDMYGAHEVLTKAVNALEGKKWFRIEAEALWHLSFVAAARDLVELERACLERLRERYSAAHHPRLTEVDDRLARLTGG